MPDHHIFVYGDTIFEIPLYGRYGIEEYVQLGKPPDSFLRAVICNDLKQAVGCADENNIKQIPAYVNYFYNHAPAECWGSEANFNDWMNKGGLIGIRKKMKAQRTKGKERTLERNLD